ncbi:MAG: nitroreductase family protein, partial [Paraclostridium sp.]
MNYKYLISNKRSVREFKNQEIKESDFKIMKEYIHNSKKLLPEIKIDIKVFSKDKVYQKLKKIAGYNGHMIEAPNYIIILSEVNRG